MKRFVLALLASCGGGNDVIPDAAPTTFTLSSPSVPSKGSFDAENTCDGADKSPEFSWLNAPTGVASFALVLTDESISKHHWAIYDIPGSLDALPAGIEAGYEPANVPGAHQSIGLDGVSRVYQGPCPPALHTYSFKLYALPVETVPGTSMDTTIDDLVFTVTAHAGASTTLLGTYMH